MPRVIRRDGPLLRAGRPPARTHLPQCDPGAALRPPLAIGAVTVTFADKLARMPRYQAGAPRARPRGARAPRASPSSPPTSRPSRRTRRSSRRSSAPPRRRIATRTPTRRCCAAGSPTAHDSDPARIAVGNGSCEILLAAAEALCEPGSRVRLRLAVVLDATRTLPALSGAREIRVPLAEGDVHDLDAMLARGHRGDAAAAGLQPEQPDRHLHPGRADRRVLRAGARARDGRSSTRPTSSSRPLDDPDATLDLLRALPEPGPAAHVQQVLRPGRAAGRLRARLGPASAPPSTRVRQPFSVNALAQAAAAEAILHQDDVAGGSSRPSSSGVFVEEALRRARASTVADSQANFSWVDLGDRDEAEVVAAWPTRRRRSSAPARRSAAPATSASPTAPAPRTNASSARSRDLL